MDSILNDTIVTTQVFQLFDDDMLNIMRTSSRSLQRHLDEAKRTTGFDHGIKLVEDELQLIEIKEIHPPGKPLYYTDDDGVDQVIENGWQTRADVTLDYDQVSTIEEDIKNRDWIPESLAPVHFLLPKCMWYTHADDADITVKYGILEGNHRTESARNTDQDNVIGWIVEFDLNYIRKIANLVFNTPRNTQVKLSAKDYGEQIITEIVEGKTAFGQQYKMAYDSVEKERLVKTEIYSCTKLKSMRENIEYYIQQKNLYTPAVKAFNQDDAGKYIMDIGEWDKALDEDVWHYIHKTNKNKVIILCETKGANDLSVAHKLARMQTEFPEKQVMIVANVTSKMEARQKMVAQNFREKIINKSETMSQADFSSISYDVRYIPKSKKDLMQSKKTNNPFLHA